MLFGLLVTIFFFICVFMILLILIQSGKSSMGLASMYGGGQNIFGGSGGQDIFQKTTWILGAIFMTSSLFLAIMKSNLANTPIFAGKLPTQNKEFNQEMPMAPMPSEQSNQQN